MEYGIYLEILGISNIILTQSLIWLGNRYKHERASSDKANLCNAMLSSSVFYAIGRGKSP